MIEILSQSSESHIQSVCQSVTHHNNIFHCQSVSQSVTELSLFSSMQGDCVDFFHGLHMAVDVIWA